MKSPVARLSVGKAKSVSWLKGITGIREP